MLDPASNACSNLARLNLQTEDDFSPVLKELDHNAAKQALDSVASAHEKIVQNLLQQFERFDRLLAGTPPAGGDTLETAAALGKELDEAAFQTLAALSHLHEAATATPLTADNPLLKCRTVVLKTTTHGLEALLRQRLLSADIEKKLRERDAPAGGGWWVRWRARNKARLKGGAVAAPVTPQPIATLAGQTARAAVFCDLFAPPEEATLDPEPQAVRRLRQFSHYLNPQTGMFSADTWTLPATVLRNMLLNWQVLVPALAAMLLLPRVHVSLANKAVDSLLFPFAAIGFVLAILAVGKMRFSLPSMGGTPLREEGFIRQICLPLFVSSWFLTLAWSWWIPADPDAAAAMLPSAKFFVGFSITMHLLGRLRLSYIRNFFGFRLIFDATAALLSGALEGYMLWFVADKFFPCPRDFTDHGKIVQFACWSTPAVLMAFLLATTVYIGLASFWTSDEDREWYARAGGWLLLVITLTTSLNLLVFYGVPVLLKAKSLIVAAGGISGIVTIFMGRSAPSGTNNKQSQNSPLNWLAGMASKLAAPVFAAAILLAISTFGQWLNGLLLLRRSGLDLVGVDLGSLNLDQHEYVLKHTEAFVLVEEILVMVGISLLMGFFINVNKFSLHAMYRNRLIRAYLGASRSTEERNPNPFTGFDPDDNVPMHAIRSHQKPFHVLNLNLNLAGKPGKAWQERKAESFTVSPLHCGSQRIQGEGQIPHTGAYRRSVAYASVPPEGPQSKGITLGTAIAVSGAAANPNMGYNSSTLVAFLMTFFNARLGCWFGNPGMRRKWLRSVSWIHPTWERAGPRFSLRSLLTEALSMIDDRHPYVNLSDGGHFENMALYEMVARRCHFIFAIDNGKDNAEAKDYAFEDLGNAIRKIRVDFGVPIDIDFRPIRNQETHFVSGRIKYSAVDGADVEDGFLVVVKPVFAGDDEPADVFNYQQAHPDFPQESTSDQWFSESQFESYRILGQHSVEKMPAAEWIGQIERTQTTPPGALAAGQG